MHMFSLLSADRSVLPVYAVHMFNPLSANSSVLPVFVVHLLKYLSPNRSVLPVFAVHILTLYQLRGLYSVFADHIFNSLSADRSVFPVFAAYMFKSLSADRSVLPVFTVYVFFTGGPEAEGRVTSGNLARVHLADVNRLNVLLEVLRGGVPVHAQGALKVFLLHRLLGSKKKDIVEFLSSSNPEDMVGTG